MEFIEDIFSLAFEAKLVDDKTAIIDGDDDIDILPIRKIDALEKFYTLKDKYIPIVEANYPKNEIKFMRHIAAYRDYNNEKLSTIYPLTYTVFGPKDHAILYECTGINPKELEEDIAKVKLPAGVNKKENFTTQYSVIVMILHWYQKHKGKPERRKLVYHYFAYSMWFTIFHNSFRFDPDKKVMEYTINNSNQKFILKQVGSIDKLLYYGVSTAVEAYPDLLADLFDCSFYYIIDAVKTRLKGYTINIAKKYYANYEAGNVIMKSEDRGLMLESINSDADTSSLAMSTTTKFFSEKPRRELCNMMAEVCAVSAKELEIVLTMMVDKRDVEEVQRFYECLFYQYLHEDNRDNDINNKKEFINRMNIIYKKGHTKNKNDIEVKRLLNKWLEEGSKTYRKTTSGTTQNNYRRAVYMYFVFLVVQK